MFGYVTPLICELKVGEYNLYKSIYCGLCKNIKQNYGFLRSIFLSYDMIFLTIMELSFFDEPIEFEKKFCILHPFRKKLCLKNCKSLRLAADLTIIFSWFKLKDQLTDEKITKKLATQLILIFMRKSFKKASVKQANLFKIIKTYFDEQQTLEKQKIISIDAACHPTAKCLGNIFKKLFSKSNFNSDLNNQLYNFGYMLGRFIYLADALDDCEKDFKSKNFNPLLNKLAKEKSNNKTLSNEQIDQIFESAFFTINLTLAQLAQNFKKINIIKLKPIAENIIYLGLNNSQQRIFKKHNRINLLKKLNTNQIH